MLEEQRLDLVADDELLRRLEDLLRQSRRVEVELVAHIAEVDARRLYAREGSSSMFTYCTDVLHLSEHQAYERITAARATRRFPQLLEMLDDGRLHLSGISRLVGHLTEKNCDEVLARAAHKTKKKIEELVAELAPRPDVQPVIRKLPERAATSRSTPPPTNSCRQELPALAAPAPTRRPAVVEPLAPARFKVQFTASASLRDKLRRLEALMQCDLAEVIDVAVTEKLKRLEAARFGKTKSPRTTLEETDTSATGSRYMPAAVKRAVCARDENQCTFVGQSGRRCPGRDQLEFHHDDPHAKGGDRSVDNVKLLCKQHNLLLAEREYGKEVMDAFRHSGSKDRVSEPLLTYFARNELPSRWPASPRRVPVGGDLTSSDSILYHPAANQPTGVLSGVGNPSYVTVPP